MADRSGESGGAARLLNAEAERLEGGSDVDEVRRLRDKRRRGERGSPGKESRARRRGEGAMFHAGRGVPVRSSVVVRARAIVMSWRRVLLSC
jgi:hypothetical protein